MAEQMISRDDAAKLKERINAFVNDLEREGFTRGQVGSAIAGVGFALVEVHLGESAAENMLQAIYSGLKSATARH